MSWAPIKDIAKDVKAQKLSAVSLVNEAIKNLEASSEYKAIISLTKARALKRAKEIDEAASSGRQLGRLAGVPFVAKDNFLSFGAETTAASNILKGFNSPYQATAINKLEAEGAICVAKANLDAFGHGASTENSDFMVTKNPFDKTRVSGGSSGGSAAVVALQAVPFSIGTDTGGSIRLPASFCGVVGYKPTYGLVSRSGVVAMVSSTDTIGPIASSVEDASLVIDVMHGKDALDGTTIELEETDLSNLAKLKTKPRVAIIKDYFEDGLQAGVRDQLNITIDKLRASGIEIEEVSLPSLKYALAVYYILCPAEVSSNLSRYDGQRYGFSASKANDLEDAYKATRTKGFGKEAKRRLMIGTYVLSSGYYDAYYKRAQIARTRLISEMSDVFAKYDFLLGPTAATTAFKIGERAGDPLQMYLTDLMTVAVNLAGLPAISLPAGKADNLPVGLQIMAAQKKDHDLLCFAEEVEGLIR